MVSTINEEDKKVKHECNEDIVLNIKELKKDTKPCPKCGMGIFKIDGCFSPDNKILTFDGEHKLAKDIKVGDQLCGMDLKPRTVLETCQGEDEMYLIKQTRGIDYKVNSKHTLVLQYTNNYMESDSDEDYYNVMFLNDKYKISGIDFDSFEKSLEFYKEENEKFIEVTVEDYLALPIIIKHFLKGIIANGHLMGKNLSDIEVISLGKGKYNGFTLDKDHMFLLPDGTMARNCNTMFCLSCQTYFDWASGRIYKRAVHNPDAVRWMREQGTAIPREGGDDGCTDPFVDNHVFYNWMYRTGKPYLKDHTDIFNTIMELSNYGTHINEVVVPRFADHYTTKSQELSVDYLITEGYTEIKWKKDIRKFKKQQMFNHEFRNIITLLTEVMRTVLGNVREMITRKMPPNDIAQQLELVATVAIECNEKFEDIKGCFNSKRKNCFNIFRERENVLFELRYR